MSEQALRDAIADLRNDLLGAANMADAYARIATRQHNPTKAAMYWGHVDACRMAAAKCTTILHPGKE